MNRPQILLRILLLALLVLLLAAGGYLIFRARPQLSRNPDTVPSQQDSTTQFKPDRLDPLGPVQMFVNTDNNGALWQVKGRLITPPSPSGQMLRSRFVIEGDTTNHPIDVLLGSADRHIYIGFLRSDKGEDRIVWSSFKYEDAVAQLPLDRQVVDWG